MDKIYIGKLCGTHGIKGEVKLNKIINYDLKKEDKVIIKNKEYKITSLRIHKNYYLITIDNMFDINMIFDLKNEDVYMNRENIKVDLLPEDLIGFKVINENNEYGEVVDVINGKNLLLQISFNNKTYYIPYYADFITNVDSENKILNVLSSVEELII